MHRKVLWFFGLVLAVSSVLVPSVALAQEKGDFPPRLDLKGGVALDLKGGEETLFSQYVEKTILKPKRCYKVKLASWHINGENAKVEVDWVIKKDRDGDSDTKSVESLATGGKNSETRCFCGVIDVKLRLNSKDKTEGASVEVKECDHHTCPGKGGFEECQ